MAAERRAEVTWQGDLMSGAGRVERVGSGAFGGLSVSWPARTEEAPGDETSPEELIAAAHAGCFSMAFSHALAQAGHVPRELKTAATVAFVPGTGITKTVIEVDGDVPGIAEDDFLELAEQAKENCPVSKALAGNVELQLEARLRSAVA